MIKIWRKAPSRAKHPLCIIEPTDFESPDYGFRIVFPNSSQFDASPLVSSDTAQRLIDRHLATGNRVEVVKP